MLCNYCSNLKKYSHHNLNLCKLHYDMAINLSKYKAKKYNLTR